jgi:poly-gamma-glutamate capsule biosynthesis protein CapA/YwtB (metallophosphatase superfamily)
MLKIIQKNNLYITVFILCFVLSGSQKVLASYVENPPIKKITLFAVGDIMMHKSQILAGYNKKTDSFDFSSFFKNINTYLKDGDIVYGNLESPIAGQKFKYTGYPAFNAPEELLVEIKKNFFTHLSLTNNHALDRGYVGLSNTIENVKKYGFVGFGARNDSTKPNYEITEKNGLSIGFLAYTYGTNSITLPKSKKYMLSYINKNQIKIDIEELKKQNVDVVVVAIHFGDEYKLQENIFQKDIAQSVCDSGANIVLGSHPHVLEPIVFLNDKKCLVTYSLGNFISSMSQIYTDLGGILKIEISKENEIIYLKPEFMGTWVKRGFDKNGLRYYTILPLDIDKIPNEIELTKTEKSRLEKYRNFINTKIKKY